ncbi:MAG: hypothetical protein ACE5M4_13550, partial [Anaerolineales bacterium]
VHQHGEEHGLFRSWPHAIGEQCQNDEDKRLTQVSSTAIVQEMLQVRTAPEHQSQSYQSCDQTSTSQYCTPVHSQRPLDSLIVG